MNDQYIDNLLSISEKIPDMIYDEPYVMVFSPGEMIALATLVSDAFENLENKRKEAFAGKIHETLCDCYEKIKGE